MGKKRKKKEEVEIVIDKKGKIWYLPAEFPLLVKSKIKHRTNKFCG